MTTIGPFTHDVQRVDGVMRCVRCGEVLNVAMFTTPCVGQSSTLLRLAFDKVKSILGGMTPASRPPTKKD